MADGAAPITERPNELTSDVDISTTVEIVRLLRQVDAQIFSGWRAHAGLYDSDTIATILKVAESACEVLERGSGRGHIVLSGCGTSGRLAFVVTRTFNAHLATLSLPPLYHYLVAGGDGALLKSEEATEDSWQAGASDLMKMTDGMERVLYVGITCGLSAPYVAGQLDLCLQNGGRFTPVLLGFNPTHLARQTPIKDSAKTFRDVVCQMQREHHLILNPVVGPEAITGSTRMKGGTATKILLEAIFTLAHERMQHGSWRSSPTSLLQAYELTYRHTYTNTVTIATEQDSALSTASLMSKGHLYYLGAGTPGIMAVIDASECPPTFGADYGDVRGFIQDGYQALGNREGDLAKRGSDYELGANYLHSSIVPSMTHNDCVIVVAKATDALWSLPHPGSAHSSSLHHSMAVIVRTDRMPQVDTSLYEHAVVVTLPWQPLSAYWSPDMSPDFLLEAAVKWVLNAISTGAHVMSGKVLRNRMIDLKVSNSKLFNRAVGIIKNFSGCDELTATQHLLAAVYDGDLVRDGSDSNRKDKDHAAIPQHIARATHKDKVVPLSLLLSTGQYSVTSGKEALQKTPVIRQLLAQHVHMSSCH